MIKILICRSFEQIEAAQIFKNQNLKLKHLLIDALQNEFGSGPMDMRPNFIRYPILFAQILA